MFCKYCDVKLSDGSVFCPNCGGNNDNDTENVIHEYPPEFYERPSI